MKPTGQKGKEKVVRTLTMDFTVPSSNEKGPPDTRPASVAWCCRCPPKSVWAVVGKQWWGDRRRRVKRLARQPLQSHLTGRWPSAGGCILVQHRQDAGRTFLLCKLPLEHTGRQSKLKLVAPTKSVWCPLLPRKMPTGVRSQDWHGETGFSSGIFRDIPPPVPQRGRVSVYFCSKMISGKQVLCSWGWRTASSAVFPSVLGELMPSGSGRPSLSPPFSATEARVLLCYPWQASSSAGK